MKSSVSLPALAVALATAGCANRSDPPATDRSTSRVGSDEVPGAAAEAEKPADEASPPDRGPERAVYSLADNRLAAHIGRRGGVLIPAGSAGLAKYLRFPANRNPWELRQERDGVAVARMKGGRANLRVPLAPEQAGGEVAVAVRVFSPAAGRLAIEVQGHRDQPLTADLDKGWSVVELTAEAGLFDAGENDIEIVSPRGAQLDVAWIQIGGEPGGDSDVAGDADPLPVFADGALQVPAEGELAYYVMVPEDGRLTGNVNEDGCEVEAKAQPDGGDPVGGRLSGAGSAVDLGALAGKVVRLSLSASGCDVAKLADAALVVPGTAPEPADDAAAPRYAFLWIMDSLRADRVRPFFPGARPETPTFDALAETSAVFTQAYVQGTESRASHASIWTSLYPVRHRMPQQRQRLPADLTTIDEVMKGAGLYTSGVSANGYITPRKGFGTMWDRYRNHIHLKIGLQGDKLLEAALGSVQKRSEPWFVYLGTIDTHVSWRAKDPWIDKYDPEPYQGRFRRVAAGPLIDRIASGEESVSKRDIQRIRALYDSNVSYQDMLLGRLLEWLEERGIADETMIVVTADHGDELWEAGRVGHGATVRDSVVHVPLLVHYPPLVPAGSYSEGAEVIDIMPTFADAFGVEADQAWQGESLIRIARGDGLGYPRMSMASLYERRHAARLGPWKLRVSGRQDPKLFHMADEPEEKTDVIGEHPIARRFVSDALWTLRTFSESWNKASWGNAANVRAAFPAAMNE